MIRLGTRQPAIRVCQTFRYVYKQNADVERGEVDIGTCIEGSDTFRNPGLVVHEECAGSCVYTMQWHIECPGSKHCPRWLSRHPHRMWILVALYLRPERLILLQHPVIRLELVRL